MSCAYRLSRCQVLDGVPYGPLRLPHTMPTVAFHASEELVLILRRHGIDPKVFAREAFEIAVRRLAIGPRMGGEAFG